MVKKVSGSETMDKMTVSTSLGDYEPLVSRALTELLADRTMPRIWSKDYTVWKPAPAEIANRLGWLDSPRLMADRLTWSCPSPCPPAAIVVPGPLNSAVS